MVSVCGPRPGHAGRVKIACRRRRPSRRSPARRRPSGPRPGASSAARMSLKSTVISAAADEGDRRAGSIAPRRGTGAGRRGAADGQDVLARGRLARGAGGGDLDVVGPTCPRHLVLSRALRPSRRRCRPRRRGSPRRRRRGPPGRGRCRIRRAVARRDRLERQDLPRLERHPIEVRFDGAGHSSPPRAREGVANSRREAARRAEDDVDRPDHLAEVDLASRPPRRQRGTRGRGEGAGDRPVAGSISTTSPRARDGDQGVGAGDAGQAAAQVDARRCPGCA